MYPFELDDLAEKMGLEKYKDGKGMIVYRGRKSKTKPAVIKKKEILMIPLNYLGYVDHSRFAKQMGMNDLI
jgi:hypothetical protein